MLSGFLGGFLGALLADIALRAFDQLVGQDLNSIEKTRTIIDGIVRPRSKPIQKRKPKVLTDLMAYQNEIKEEGESRG